MQTIVAVISCFLTLTVASPPDYCPKPADLAPCTCDGEGFSCRKAKDENAIKKALSSKSLEDTARAMYIQGTSLKRLPKDVFGRFKFGEFHLDVNQIAEVESGVFRGSQAIVYSISMYNNKIAAFPFNDVEKLPYLQALSLAKNKLTTIPGPMAFGRHNSLEIIHLAENSISRIGKSAFSGLARLSILDLQGNKLTTLESQAFNMVSHSPELQIGLNNNGLTAVAADAFGSSTPAAIIMAYNRMTTIPQKPFMNMMLHSRAPTQILVEGNPLTCQGCNQYQWIVQYKNYLYDRMHGFSCNNRKTLSTLTLRDIGCAGY